MEKVNKKFPVDSQKRRTMLLPAVAVLFILSAVFQKLIDPDAKQFHRDEKSVTALGGLNNEFLLLPLLGFREAAAGLLWVRCDEFFHSGDYDAILPLVRVITWLDPHADNIFVTGAWHLAYNFTDSSERSDRRYIAPAQALLDEGIINNMNIPDIKFEKGWQNYDKIKDFITAEKALIMARDTPPNKNSDDFPYGAPLKVDHLLAHTYEKQGRLPEALAAWNAALKRSSDMLKKKPTDYSTRQLHSAEQHNHDEALQRYRDRYTSTGHSAVNTTSYPAVLRPTPSNPKPHLWNCVFAPHIDVTRPKVFKVSGRFNAADGARIDVRFTDWDFKERPIAIAQNTFDIDLTQTILVDSIAVRKNRFERELDMSKDPKMYGFNQDYYRMVLQYNTRITSPHLQDRFGWSGEGITDENAAHVYVEKNELLKGTKYIEGQGGEGPVWDGQSTVWPQHGQAPRMIRVTYKISRDQVEGRKPITDADIVPNE